MDGREAVVKLKAESKVLFSKTALNSDHFSWQIIKGRCQDLTGLKKAHHVSSVGTDVCRVLVSRAQGLQILNTYVAITSSVFLNSLKIVEQGNPISFLEENAEIFNFIGKHFKTAQGALKIH